MMGAEARVRRHSVSLGVARCALVLCAVSWAAACEPPAPDPEGDASVEPGTDARAVCTSDLDCDDGLYCNGTDRCAPNAAEADARGCVRATTDVCRTDERCNEDNDRCELDCAVEPDADGDGHVTVLCGGDDCDDHDANRYPGNTEVCDPARHDEDCNTATHGFVDADGDGVASSVCCNGDDCEGDCDDGNASINPGEDDTFPLSCNGVDDDCDGEADELCPCEDGDTRECGSAVALAGRGECAPGLERCTRGSWSGICEGAIEPAMESCDGEDDDCDGTTDEGVQATYYRDADGDGYGVPSSVAPSTLACSTPVGYAANDTDCDDASSGQNPANTEVCNGIDDDCDGRTDEGLRRRYYRDDDRDGYGVASASVDTCTPAAGYVLDPGDCDDTRAGVRPGATEICDALDNDCDTRTDEGVLRTYYEDRDGDRYGRTTVTRTACSTPAGFVEVGGDCDDTRSAVSPGRVELCNGLDDDCSGTADEGCSCTDGSSRACTGGTDVGECARGTQLCIGGTWQACNGQITAVAETCNSRDDDCDGNTDETVEVAGCLADADSDGYGAGLGTPQCRDATRMSAGYCPPGYTTTAGDCNDGSSGVRPGASETCNQRDDDCDGRVDEGATISCYFDGDGDGHGAGSTVAVCADPSRTGFGGCPSGYTNVTGDCNDGVGTIRPGAVETCNGINDDCDANVDEGTTASGCYPDFDGDLFGASGVMPSTQCRDASRSAFGFCPVGWVNSATDCNDSQASVRPMAMEACNLRDDDCDTRIDEGAQITYYRDVDRDGYGGTTTIAACTAPSGYVAASGDCDDGSATVYPGAPEACDGIDQNCTAGITDEPRRTFYRDADGDLYGNSAMTTLSCTVPSGYVEYAGDCNDAAPGIRPGAVELCNGVDDDCAGGVDVGAAAQCPGQYPAAVHVASWGCTSASCRATCESGWADCDGVLANGCEVNTRTSADHCGVCGNSCGVAGSCNASSCDPIVDLVAGTHTTCIRRGSGRVACWGDGTNGQLLTPLLSDASTPQHIEDLGGIAGIAISHRHWFAHSGVYAWTSVNPALYSWGDNQFGTIGDGTYTGPRTTPYRVRTGTVAQVAAGADHTCVRLGTSVYCWGDNTRLQLGVSSVSTQSMPSSVTLSGYNDVSAGFSFGCGITTGGVLRCWGQELMGKCGNNDNTGDTLPVNVVLPSGFSAPTDVESGYYHSCAISATSSTTTVCWGGGAFGKLGNGATTDRLVATAVSTSVRFAQMALGEDHTCGRTAAGQVYCWGRGGIVGDGTSTQRATPVLISGLSGVIDIAAGVGHTCALESDGDVWCWGENGDGQLGDGTGTNRLAPVRVFGL